jgi:hypothetical protein
MAARSVLLVDPIGFGLNEHNPDNSFQATEGIDQPTAEKLAREEFALLLAALQTKGIRTFVFPGRAEAPDATFPNNWFSTHDDGHLILYPMRSELRRHERREDIIDWLQTRYPTVLDFSSREERGEFLEGTGSMVLDRENKIAFASLSGRTSEKALRFWCAHRTYEPVVFESSDSGGMPIYHTNVLLALGKGWAVVCSECIHRPAPVLSALISTGRELIEITRHQMACFCGNVLELENEAGERFIFMSQAAVEGFTTEQKERLSSFAELVAVPVPTIEKFGGGGVRCMIAELF